MHVRLTFIEIDSKDSKEVSALYNTEVVPQIREFKGLKDVYLLEPTDGSGAFVSVTIWESASDAAVYESTGTYKRLVDLFKGKTIAKPVLKTYNTQESAVPAM